MNIKHTDQVMSDAEDVVTVLSRFLTARDVIVWMKANKLCADTVDALAEAESFALTYGRGADLRAPIVNMLSAIDAHHTARSSKRK